MFTSSFRRRSYRARVPGDLSANSSDSKKETLASRSVVLDRLPAGQAARRIRKADRVENLSAKVDNSGVRYHA